MSVFTCDKGRRPFSIHFLLDFTAHARSIFKMFTSMNLRKGSFLKPFNKLAVRVLSGINTFLYLIKHSWSVFGGFLVGFWSFFPRFFVRFFIVFFIGFLSVFFVSFWSVFGRFFIDFWLVFGGFLVGFRSVFLSFFVGFLSVFHRI